MLTGGATWLTVRNMNMEEIRKEFLNYILEEYEKSKKRIIPLLKNQNANIDNQLNQCEKIIIKKYITGYIKQELSKEKGYITDKELVCLYSMREGLLDRLTSLILSRNQYNINLETFIEWYIYECVRSNETNTYPFNNLPDLFTQCAAYMSPIMMSNREKGFRILSNEEKLKLIDEVNEKIMPKHLMFDKKAVLDPCFEDDILLWK